jgi:glycosyltransferase involved in cell wall biosynthesis
VRVLVLYRPRLPSLRAQAIQVLHAAHALAARGHRVTVLADRGDGAATPRAALGAMGLDEVDGLDLRIAPTTWNPGASAWFRAQLVEGFARGRWDVVLARAKRYVRWVPRAVPLVVEAHELDSALAAERGEDPAPWRALERAVFGRARGVVANCEGTLACIEAAHTLPSVRAVIHNATRPDRAVIRTPSALPTVLYAGTLGRGKGAATLAESLPYWPHGSVLRMVGVSDGSLLGRGGIPPQRPPGGAVEALPGVAPQALPALLATAHAVVLPLEDSLFGRCMTSPLKLWDARAAGLPVAASDLPAVRAIAGDVAHLCSPGDPVALADAVRRALASPGDPPRLRTWASRAAEVEAVLEAARA